MMTYIKRLVFCGWLDTMSQNLIQKVGLIMAGYRQSTKTPSHKLSLPLALVAACWGECNANKYPQLRHMSSDECTQFEIDHVAKHLSIDSSAVLAVAEKMEHGCGLDYYHYRSELKNQVTKVAIDLMKLMSVLDMTSSELAGAIDEWVLRRQPVIPQQEGDAHEM